LKESLLVEELVQLLPENNRGKFRKLRDLGFLDLIDQSLESCHDGVSLLVNFLEF